MGRRREAADAAGELKRSPTASPSPSPSTRVYVGRVPPSLCLHEPGIRQHFEPFGAISSITVHHDALSTGADGFLFLEYADARAARAAVAAVTQADEAGDVSRFEGMNARLAVARGAPAYVAEPAVVDLLLGRRPAGGFSQHSQSQRHSSSAFLLSQHDEQDEDELFLQSLSQRTTRRSSQRAATPSRKRKKRRGNDDEDDG